MHRTDGRRTPLLMAIALIAAVGLLAGACSKSDTASSPGTTLNQANTLADDGTPTPGGKLVIGVMAETAGWSNITNLWADVGNFMGSAVLEPLMSFDAEGTPQPWLAESVTPSTPGKFDVWKVKIRDGVQFHNGEKLDAAVVKRNLDINTQESLASVATKDMIKEITVTDPMTVEVKLAKPWSAFPAFLANVSGYISANEALDSTGHGSEHPIGTGPFQFVSWTRDSASKFKKFANYWQKGKPYVDEIEFRPIPDNKQRAAGLQAGNLDMILTTSAEDAVNLQADYQVVKDYNSEKTIVMINVAEDPTKLKNPLHNAHMRKALAYATNTDDIKALFGTDAGLQTSTTPLNATSKWKMDEGQTGALKFDLAKAKSEVEAYKSETGDTAPKIVLTGQANLDEQKLQQVLQSQWKQAGVDVELSTLEQAAFVQQQVLGGFQAAIFRNYGYVEPDSNYYFFHSSTAKGLGLLSINFHQYKDPGIDADLDGARETDDFAKRKALYEDLTRRVNDGGINIWLFNTPYAIIASKNVKGLNNARKQSFGNFLAKTWLWTDIWKQSATTK